MLLVIGVVAIVAGLGVAAVALAAGPNDAVARTIRTVDRGYRVAGADQATAGRGAADPRVFSG